MRERILLCISIALLMSCGQSKNTADQPAKTATTAQVADGEEKVASEKVASEEATADEVLPDCMENSRLILNGGSGDREMEVMHCLAIRKINMNEQTDVGDVAKDGYTICIADYELNQNNIWGRPPGADNQKVELRLFIPAGEQNLTIGKYGAASKGSLQMAPVLYLGENTHPFMGNDLGEVQITRVSETEICGHMRARTKFGHKLEGSFTASIL